MLHLPGGFPALPTEYESREKAMSLSDGSSGGVFVGPKSRTGKRPNSAVRKSDTADSNDCPECGGKYVRRCRCRLADSVCEAGHKWHRCPDCRKVVSGTSFHDGSGENRCDDCAGHTREKGCGNHDYASTQIDLPTVVAHQVNELAAVIRPEDLDEKGVEREPHVTVRYGLTCGAERVKAAVEGFPPVEYRVGKFEVFERDGEPDVLYLAVESRDLIRLNWLLSALPGKESDHPKYVPHLTVAYLKPGMGAVYAAAFNGVLSLRAEGVASQFTFSDEGGRLTTIPLTGTPAEHQSLVKRTTAVPAGGVREKAAQHAPHNVTIGGKEYRGGEFIPAGVMAAATPAERAEVEGTGAATEGGGRQDDQPAFHPAGEPVAPKASVEIESDDVGSVAGKLFGRGYNAKHLMAAANAADGSVIRAATTGMPGGRRALVLTATHEASGLMSARTFFKDSRGKLVCINGQFTNPKGGSPTVGGKPVRGADLLANQIAALRKLGVKEVRTFAAGGAGSKSVGHVVWPKLGFDGKIPAAVRNRMPPALAAAVKAGGGTLSTLHAVEGGADWWAKNGEGQEMKFDPADGSQSMVALSAYLKNRDSKPTGGTDGQRPEGGNHPPAPATDRDAGRQPGAGAANAAARGTDRADGAERGTPDPKPTPKPDPKPDPKPKPKPNPTPRPQVGDSPAAKAGPQPLPASPPPAQADPRTKLERDMDAADPNDGALRRTVGSQPAQPPAVNPAVSGRYPGDDEQRRRNEAARRTAEEAAKKRAASAAAQGVDAGGRPLPTDKPQPLPLPPRTPADLPAAKTAAPPRYQRANAATDVLHRAIHAHPDLPPEAKAGMAEAAYHATKRMPKAAVAHIAKNLKDAHVATDLQSMRRQVQKDTDAIMDQIAKGAYEKEAAKAGTGVGGWIKRQVAKASVKAARLVAGAIGRLATGGMYGGYSGKTGKMYLSAGSKVNGSSEAHVHSHELTHAIDHDGVFSGHPDWQSAHSDEIDQKDHDGTGRLTDYARTSPSEGFAEFGAAAYTGDTARRAELAKKFPKCAAYFRRHGLWPAD